MAIYGTSIYGEDKYGPPQYVDFSVDPFVASPAGYDHILLTWTSPKGTWDSLRLVRSLQGYPVHEGDGQVVLERSGAAAHFTDTAPQPGAWHYYAVFILSEGEWYRAGTATALMPKDAGYADRLFTSLPLYHQYLHGVGDNENPEVNETLQTYMLVLGLGLDEVKSYYDQLLNLNDATKNHAGQLEHLANQLGIEVPSVSEPAQFRQRVANAGILGRQKGSLEEIRTVIARTTGWDVDLTVGPNLMLSEDAASFVHPSYDLWDPTVNYPAGDRITYNGFVYQAKTGGAYGNAQQPSGTATSNTWWTLITNQKDDTLKQADGTIQGWGPAALTGVAKTAADANLGVGIQSAVDPTVSSSNALLFSNVSGVTADAAVTSTSGADTDPLRAIKRGVPMLQVMPRWDPTVLYRPGDIATYYDRVFRALILSEGIAPSQSGIDTAQWQCIGDDLRPTYTTSMYIIGETGYQNVLAYPVAQFFDDKGALQATLDTSQITGSTNIFDSFGYKGAASIDKRTTDVGSRTWSEAGAWSFSDHGTVYPIASSSVGHLSGAADGKVAVTFYSSPSPGKKQGLILRYAGISSYLKAARDGLYSYDGTADTLIGTYSTPFEDGDRMVVDLKGTAITVYRNGVQVLSATSSINTTASQHGIFVA